MLPPPIVSIIKDIHFPLPALLLETDARVQSLSNSDLVVRCSIILGNVHCVNSYGALLKNSHTAA